MIWDHFIELEGYMSTMMEGFCGQPTDSLDLPTVGNHINKVYRSDKVDLAHISVIDMRAEKKMWMMHVACFAKPNFPMPIYGFDVIVGKNKVTGCFHDMSPTIPELLVSTAEQEFKQIVAPFIPKRERELPPWAKEIFSNSMVVAGATNEVSEIENLCYMGRENLSSWFSSW
jgi:phycocyanobilin:ferredoxin oxidoreductase